MSHSSKMDVFYSDPYNAFHERGSRSLSRREKETARTRLSIWKVRWPAWMTSEVLQLQVRQGTTHRRCQARRARPLDFKSQSAPSPDNKEVKLSARVRSREETLISSGPQAPCHLPDDETLPGRTNLGMRFEVPKRYGRWSRPEGYPAATRCASVITSRGTYRRRR